MASKPKVKPKPNLPQATPIESDDFRLKPKDPGVDPGRRRAASLRREFQERQSARDYGSRKQSDLGRPKGGRTMEPMRDQISSRRAQTPDFPKVKSNDLGQAKGGRTVEVGRTRAAATRARASAVAAEADFGRIKAPPRASIAQRVGAKVQGVLKPLGAPAEAIRSGRTQLLERHAAGMKRLAEKAASRIAVKAAAVKEASVIGTKIPKALGVGMTMARSAARQAAGSVAGKVVAKATSRLVPGIGTVVGLADAAYSVGRAGVEGVRAIQAERERRDLEHKVREKIKTGAYRARAVPPSRL